MHKVQAIAIDFSLTSSDQRHINGIFRSKKDIFNGLKCKQDRLAEFSIEPIVLVMQMKNEQWPFTMKGHLMVGGRWQGKWKGNF